MTIKDIVALAKAGYKPSDVKELLEMSETDPNTKNKEVPTEPTETKPESDPEPEESIFEKIAKENN